ncbi:hypothetical protein [Bifidobacterium xylocopae]|uniref:Uncharacterized protein n=1 Tax=Bifidobacterium xylocopae TaxID=2493119 RepID=A0A366KAP8_9BIFI|nr:hypothetical protein [Bifidobacterium xylocopae]RBP98800.1 hypothetical protein CRD59_07225 [Bifidobacterium xylocopae]
MKVQQPAATAKSLANTLASYPERQRPERKTQASFMLPAETHRRLKRFAADKGVSMSAIVAEWIEANC